MICKNQQKVTSAIMNIFIYFNVRYYTTLFIYLYLYGRYYKMNNEKWRKEKGEGRREKGEGRKEKGEGRMKNEK